MLMCRHSIDKFTLRIGSYLHVVMCVYLVITDAWDGQCKTNDTSTISIAFTTTMQLGPSFQNIRLISDGYQKYSSDKYYIEVKSDRGGHPISI